MKTKLIPSVSDLTKMRFLSKVTLPNERGCCQWTAYTDDEGYGTFCIGNKMMVKAHRFSYELFIGSIAQGLEVDHRCHNHSCVAPSHLRAVTNKQNQEHRSGAQAGARSGILGVNRTSRGQGKWQVRVGHNGVRHYLGSYDSLEAAESAAIAGRLALFTHNDRDRLIVGE